LTDDMLASPLAMDGKTNLLSAKREQLFGAAARLSSCRAVCVGTGRGVSFAAA